MHLHIHFFKESRKRWYCTRKKNGLIILVEIGVFVLRRKKWGNGLALAATTKLHRYLKMKKNWNYVGKWVVNDAREWIIIHWINYKFFGQWRRSTISHYLFELIINLRNNWSGQVIKFWTIEEANLKSIELTRNLKNNWGPGSNFLGGLYPMMVKNPWYRVVVTVVITLAWWLLVWVWSLWFCQSIMLS